MACKTAWGDRHPGGDHPAAGLDLPVAGGGYRAALPGAAQPAASGGRGGAGECLPGSLVRRPEFCPGDVFRQGQRDAQRVRCGRRRLQPVGGGRRRAECRRPAQFHSQRVERGCRQRGGACRGDQERSRQPGRQPRGTVRRRRQCQRRSPRRGRGAPPAERHDFRRYGAGQREQWPIGVAQPHPERIAGHPDRSLRGGLQRYRRREAQCAGHSRRGWNGLDRGRYQPGDHRTVVEYQRRLAAGTRRQRERPGEERRSLGRGPENAIGGG